MGKSVSAQRRHSSAHQTPADPRFIVVNNPQLPDAAAREILTGEFC